MPRSLFRAARGLALLGLTGALCLCLGAAAAAAPPASPRSPRSIEPPRPRVFLFEGNELKVRSGTVSFEPGSDKLKADSDEALAEVRDYLLVKTHITLMRIEDHSDNEDGASGQELSERRALAVARWLISAGVPCQRLLAVGFGDAVGQALNRRTAFVNVALRGKPISAPPDDGGGKVAGDLCPPVSKMTSKAASHHKVTTGKKLAQ